MYFNKGTGTVFVDVMFSIEGSFFGCYFSSVTVCVLCVVESAVYVYVYGCVCLLNPTLKAVELRMG